MSAEEIANVNADFMRAFGAGDLDAFAQLYTDDCIVMLPGVEALMGGEGARKFLNGAKDRGVAGIELETLELEIIGETAWERGRAVARFADGRMAGKNKYLVVWKRRDGRWRLHRDIMNPDPIPVGIS